MADIMVDNGMKFEYTYSAKQQEEIEQIRKKYLPKKEDKLETLRRLDRETERPGTIAALIIGIAGLLLLGVGMCCTLVWKEAFFVLGIVVGILGMGILSTAYPVYKKITKVQREKVAEQILALSRELTV